MNNSVLQTRTMSPIVEQDNSPSSVSLWHSTIVTKKWWLPLSSPEDRWHFMASFRVLILQQGLLRLLRSGITYSLHVVEIYSSPAQNRRDTTISSMVSRTGERYPCRHEYIDRECQSRYLFITRKEFTPKKSVLGGGDAHSPAVCKVLRFAVILTSLAFMTLGN